MLAWQGALLDRASLVEVTVKQRPQQRSKPRWCLGEEPSRQMNKGNGLGKCKRRLVWLGRVAGDEYRGQITGPFVLAAFLLSPHTHSPLLCCLGSYLWPNQQASLTSGFLWDLANGRHLQELRGQTSLLRAPLLSEHLQQLRVALCTSGWRWGVGGGCLIPLQGCQLQGLACSGSGGSPKPLTPFGRVPLIHSPNPAIWVWYPPVFLPGS